MAGSRTAKRVTAADVARSLGLSRATVGFVLNDTAGQTIPEATRARVKAEAARLGYRPHNAARALASGRSHIVLLLLPDWPLEYSMRTNLDEAALTLDRAGYSLVTMTPHPDGQARPLWETLGPDVVLSLAPIPPERIQQIRESGVRHLIGALPADERSPDDPGYAAGPRLQVEHLVQQSGRRRIAFAGSGDSRLQDLVDERRRFAAHACRRLTGADLVASANLDAATAPATITGWLASGVDGVAAYNDEIAALVVGSALRQGVDVPGRLAVIGHDDSPLAQLFVPALSSVHVDTAGLGRQLAELALSRINDTPPPALAETDVRVIRRESS